MKPAPVVKKPEIIEPEVREKKKEVVDTSGSSQPYTEADINPPIDIYEKEEGSPYIVKYFGLKMPYYDIDESQFRKNLDVIDEFVKEEIKLSGRKPTIKEYQRILDMMKNKLDINGEVKEENIIERMAGFIRAFKRIKQLKEKKQRKEILKSLFKLAKGKDFETKELALLLEESYLKEVGLWEGA